MKNSKIILISTLMLAATMAHARLDRVSSNEIVEQMNCDSEACPSIIKRHLIRDFKNCQIHPDRVEEAPSLMKKAGLTSKNVKGHNAFLGFFPGRYSYTGTVTDQGGIKITANVYFTNYKKLSSEKLKEMQDVLDLAAQKWTSYNPYSYPLEFEFNVATPNGKKDVRAKLLIGKYTRGPYFMNWTDMWGKDTVSHEMGHVMGLDDEYSNTPFRKLTYCDRSSIMCTSSKPKPYHYYMFVRRLLCRI